jgi:hypothetical protein
MLWIDLYQTKKEGQMLEGLKPPVRQNYICKVAFYLGTLKPSDSEILKEAIDNKELWPAKTLSNGLAQRTIKIADTTITKHRNQLCACFRDDATLD